MTERSFEVRLAEALRVYTDHLPVTIDPLQVASAAAGGSIRRGGELARWRRSRLAWLVAVVALAIVLAVAVLVGSRLIHRAPLPPSFLGFTPTGTMAVARPGHQAVLLANGSVLVVGGHTSDLGGGYSVSLGTAEVYDPQTGRFTPTGSMTTPRLLFDAALLDDGQVLAIGGDPSDGAVASAELYDPTTGTWRRTGSMHTPRRQFSLTRLADGSVLVAGGSDGNGPLDDVERYDPRTGTFASAGRLTVPRLLQGAVALDDGTILMAGGLGTNGPVASSERYDPRTGTSAPSGALSTARIEPILVRLGDGRVLALDSQSTRVELYDATTGRFTSTGSMAATHTTATLLADGRVLVAGGGTDRAEIYDPVSGTFAPTIAMVANADVTSATRLENGEVLLTRGGGAPSELFDPTEPASPVVPSLAPSQGEPSTAPLPDACSLLTDREIHAVRGVEPGAGDAGTSSTDISDCTWRVAGGTEALFEVTVLAYTDDTWSALVADPGDRSASASGHEALLDGGGSLWVAAGPWLLHLGAAPPVAGGSATDGFSQQLILLEDVLSRLR
jgi:hypothetical protein